MDQNTTSRRSFLKAGAIVAAPVGAATPVMALADDGSRAKLARLEDQRAIEALHREFLRNAGGARDRFALGEGLRSVAADPAAEPLIEIAEDGRKASARHECRVELQAEFTGHTTIEQMARFQGQGSHVHEERRVLATELVKDRNGWRIAGARLA